MSRFFPVGLGWQRDLPDPRDYTAEHAAVAAILGQLLPADAGVPLRVDLREEQEGVYFSAPEDQGCLNSSSAFACLAMVEYFQRRALGHTFDGSPMFLYDMARRLAGMTGNSGVGLRATLKTLCRYGTPPHELRPYRQELSNELPSDLSFLGFSKDLEGIIYFRLDTADQSGDARLAHLKAFLAAGFPATLGFAVPRSLSHDSIVPFRPDFDAYRGGQAVLAVGYDDQRLPGQGAILIRSSWGSGWGEGGYGWLPYAFVKRGLTADLWTMINGAWLGAHEFHRPLISPAAN